MKCPKCGYPRLRYKVQRKKVKGAEAKKPEPRKNFEVEECPKCGFKDEVRDEEVIEE